MLQGLKSQCFSLYFTVGLTASALDVNCHLALPMPLFQTLVKRLQLPSVGNLCLATFV